MSDVDWPATLRALAREQGTGEVAVVCAAAAIAMEQRAVPVAEVLRNNERLRQRMQGIMHVVQTCDEEEGEDGLCECMRAIAYEMILVDRAAYGRGLRARTRGGS